MFEGLKVGLICGYHYHYYNSIRVYVTFFWREGGEKAFLGLKIGVQRRFRVLISTVKGDFLSVCVS